MKRTGKVLAILLALAMLLSVTAFAAWDVYGSNANHNSVVDSAPTTATTTALNSYIDLSNGGRGWDGVDNVPVMETVNGTTYAYVPYDGYSSYGGQLAKINCARQRPMLSGTSRSLHPPASSCPPRIWTPQIAQSTSALRTRPSTTTLRSPAGRSDCQHGWHRDYQRT